jgi:hypothetical protein
MKALLLALVITPVLIVPADAYSRCTYYRDGREPRCLYKSDSGKEQYIDGRTRRPAGRDTRSFAEKQSPEWRRAAQQRGAAAWKNSGTPSPVGTISPFVPGSVEDTAWRAERKRRGIQ